MIVVNHSKTNIQYPYGSIASDLPRLIDVTKELATNIQNHIKEPIQLLCTGSSGMLLAALVSQHIPDCVICHIKKPGERSHGKADIDTSRHLVLIDDFVDSGISINRILGHLVFKHPYSLALVERMDSNETTVGKLTNKNINYLFIEP